MTERRIRVTSRVRSNWATAFGRHPEWCNLDAILDEAEELEDCDDLRRVLRAKDPRDRYLYSHKMQGVFVVADGRVVATFEPNDEQLDYIEDVLPG